MAKACYRYLVFNYSINWAHEFVTDVFYGYQIGKNIIGKHIAIWDDSDHTWNDLQLIYYEDTVYNKTKAEYEQIKKERVERHETLLENPEDIYYLPIPEKERKTA